MENDPDKLNQNQSPPQQPMPNVVVSVTSTEAQSAAAPQQPVSPQQPAPPDQTPQQNSYDSGPKIRLSHFAVAGLGASIVLAIILPNSRAAQLLFVPILICGTAGAVSFIDKSIRTSRNTNIAAKFVLIFGGIGIGTVIFIISLIAAFAVDTAKDPHPPPPS